MTTEKSVIWKFKSVAFDL